MSNKIKLLYVDLFCGAGGTSTGVEQSTLHGEKCARVIACVNHDPKAIASHLANHPETVHFTEDIRTLAMEPLVAVVEKARKQYPDAKLVLWASLECTNFSKAKGGQPRDADSRTLADHLPRYIKALNPDYIQIENVEEFMAWGKLDENGKPVSRDNGSDYVRWVGGICNLGYTYSWRLLNAADFGAYTSRKRFFGQFAKGRLPHAFPEATYSKNGDTSDNLFGIGLNKWKPVRDVLDLDDDGESIFGRKKPLVEATLKRIYAGLVKFVAGGEEAFLVKYNSMGSNGKYVPQKVVTADCFLFNPSYQSNGGSVDNPCFTLVARMDKVPPYIVQTERGVGIELYESDSPMIRKIKEFMAAYCIIDIKMRMLKVSELKAIMGFPPDYTLVGTQSEQKKFIGNAVEVNQSRVLCEALAKRLEEVA